jgi:diguanylate cyclase (GGDEF)-like protein
VVKMSEPAKKTEREEGLDGKIVTHPAFQRVIESASSEPEEFYAALRTLQTSYEAKEAEAEDLRQKLEEAEKALEKEKRESQRLRPLAFTDGLTGAYNHRYFMEQLETEVRRSDRNRRPLSLLYTDIDNYTDFNTLHGHQAGDYVLKELTGIARKVLRDTDIFARYGGEEFAAIMPDTTEEQAESAAERLRKAVENADLEYKGEKLHFTLSIGVAPHRSESADDLITVADKLMYLGKILGKNCVVSRSYAEKELDFKSSTYSSEKQ